MKIFVLPTLVCSFSLALVPGSGSGVARAQQEGATMDGAPSGQTVAVATPQPVVPSTEPPVQLPPAPPVEPPPPPVGQAQQEQQAQQDEQDEQDQQVEPQEPYAQPAQQAQFAGSAYSGSPAPAAAQAATAGQWVYTEQYGWIWMPYGTQYTYEGGSDNIAQPYSYAYYPAYGWMWLAAPWVWGWGGYPYFGVVGPWHYPWYRGLYHAGYGWGGYRGGYAHAYANGYRGFTGFAARGPGYGGTVGASPYRGRPGSVGGYAGAVNRGGGSYGSAGGTFRGAAPVNAYGRAAVGGNRGAGFTGGAPRGGSFFGGGSSHGGGFSGGGHSFGGGFRGGHGGGRH